jgi:hypothetical protein
MHANGIGTSTASARVSMLELQTAGDVGLVAREPRARVAAPAGYAIRLFETSAEIDRAGWQKVCAGASTFMDLRFLAAVEAGMKPACQFRFAMVYDGDEPVAAPASAPCKSTSPISAIRASAGWSSTIRCCGVSGA